MTHLRPFLALSLSVITLVAATPASAQLTKDQLDKVRNERTKGITYAGTSETKSPTRHLYSIVIDPVSIDSAKARDVFTWWSNSTGIPLVINWREMEAAGIDPDTAIDLHLRNAPASAVLSLVMKSLSTESPLMYEVTDFYIRIFTKAEADKDTVTLVYDVKDLITKIPNFPNAPKFDLNSALSNTSSGGSSGGAQSATTLFDTENQVEQDTRTEAEKGEEIANLIREMIEPTIWQELGGQHSSIKYFNGRLVVKAPRYVHAQIGFPVTGGGSSKAGRFSSMTPVSGAVKTDVAGVNKNQDKVAGIAGK